MEADLGAIANRLFDGFLAPLVLGGEVTPGRPIGARAALALGGAGELVQIDRAARVELARTRVARTLVPVDRIEGPTPADWALGATLHDLVQATHPGFDAVFRRGGPPRLLAFAHETLERVPAPKTLGEALARHTWFARMFDMVRTDTVVRWWVGSRTFLGVTPPPRLSAWPELRRVRVERSPRSLMDLPGAGAAIDRVQFAAGLARFLSKTPLTDLGTCYRPLPQFAWSRESLGLVGTLAGRTLAARVLARGPKEGIDAALGRATRSLVEARAWRAASVALDLLAERALLGAALSLKGEAPLSLRDATDDAGFARSAGAWTAWERLRSGAEGFAGWDRAELVAKLEPLANGPVAQALARGFAQKEDIGSAES